MPDGISGIFFENQILTAKGLGAFANAAVSDGILTGCKVSISGTSVTIDEGYIMICGRVVKIPQRSFSISSPSSSAIYWAITATVDTSATSDEADFEQVTLTTTTGGSSIAATLGNIHSGYDSTNQFTYDINMSGTTASTWLVLFSVVSAQASVVSYNYANALGMDLLWKNSSPNSSFGTDPLSIPMLNMYDAVLVTYRKNSDTYGYYRQSMVCPFDKASSSNFVYDIIHSTLSDSAPYTNVMRQRRMTISPANGTITFTSGWLTGESDTSNGRLIPLEIYGLRAGSVHY